MAFALHIDIIDPGDGTIKVSHTFWGLTQREVETYKREHLGSCEYFRAAEQEGRTLEELEEVDEDELPEVEDEFDEEEDIAG
jgi:hypothetical protein